MEIVKISSSSKVNSSYALRPDLTLATFLIQFHSQNVISVSAEITRWKKHIYKYTYMCVSVVCTHIQEKDITELLNGIQQRIESSKVNMKKERGSLKALWRGGSALLCVSCQILLLATGCVSRTAGTVSDENELSPQIPNLGIFPGEEDVLELRNTPVVSENISILLFFFKVGRGCGGGWGGGKVFFYLKTKTLT